MFRLSAASPLRCLVFLVAMAFAFMARAEALSLGVDSSFMTPMKQLASEFEQASGHQLSISYAATGRLYQRLKAIAPFQVLLTADTTTAKRLEDERMAIEGSRFKFAAGRLAFWAAKPGLIDEAGGFVGDPALMKLAFANPVQSQFGAAAQAAIRKMPQLQKQGIRFVREDNVAAVHAAIVNGKVDMGFVALSQVIENGKIAQGSGWIVPDSVIPPVPHEAVLLDKQVLTAAAKAFVEFLKSPRAREIMRAHGYDA